MKRILIVQHHEPNRDQLVRRLAARGFEVLLADDGQTGLEIADTARPDLILLDLAMPVLSGWESARRLKASPTTRHIPLVAVTARAGTSELYRAQKAGFELVATKPVDIDALLRTLDGLLQISA
jgi:CheY-like chemotaxis protein